MATVTRRIEPKAYTADRPKLRQLHRQILPFLQISALTVAIMGLWMFWNWTASTVVIEVDGVSDTVQTHRRVLSGFLTDAGLLLGPEAIVQEVTTEESRVPVRLTLPPELAGDSTAGTGGDAGAGLSVAEALAAPQENLRLSHSVDSRISEGLRISVQRPRPFRIIADGREKQVSSWAESPAELLADAGIPFSPYDQVSISGELYGWDDTLPLRSSHEREADADSGPAWERVEREPLQLEINRSVRLTVYEGAMPYTIHTLVETVGEALHDAGITIYLGDHVQPALGTPVSSGLRVIIRRSIPVSLVADGRLYKTRTQSRKVGDFLTELGIGLNGLDLISFPLNARLYPDMQIQIVRVREETEIEDKIVPYDMVWVGDRELPIDSREVRAGADGITRWRYRVRYEDNREVARALEDVWTAQEPQNRVIVYGQKIVPQTFVDDNGRDITYWRKIRMRATSYSASTAGVSPSSPWYGYARTGDMMRKGIVAVDPSIIPLHSKVYVPGYGFGDALDTGGAIKLRRIDLGYDDHNLVLWNRWVDVYLLWPPPPEHQITWIVPDWPVEPK